jgi:hypothetical protein
MTKLSIAPGLRLDADTSAAAPSRLLAVTLAEGAPGRARSALATPTTDRGAPVVPVSRGTARVRARGRQVDVGDNAPGQG